MKISECDRNQIFRLFGIRARIWRGEALPEEDQQFSDTARSSVPNWAFFQRQKVSVDDQQAQEEANRTTTEALEQWFANADEVEIREKDGVQSVSLTFDLAKEQKKSYWKRIFRRRQPDR